MLRNSQTHKPLLLLLASALAVMSGCANFFTARRDFRVSEAWKDYERVVIHTRNGAIDLASADVSEVSICGVKCASGATLAEADRNVEQVEINSGPDPDNERVLLIEMTCPDELRWRSPGASFTVRIPKPASAELVTHNGRIEAACLRGPLDVDTSNGRVRVRSVDGDVRIHSSNGAITARDVRGDLSVRTSNGAVEVESISGACTLESSNGHVEALQVADVEATTSNGAVRVEASPTSGGRVVVRTSNGGVVLRVPRDMGAELDLSTSNGRIEAALENVPLRVREWSRRCVQATMNGGGGRIRAESSNGSIRLECD